MKQIIFFSFILLYLFPANLWGACTCSPGPRGTNIGMEFIACGVDVADNQTVTFTVHNHILCSGTRFYKPSYYYSYTQSGTPGGTAAHLASTGNYRVFKTGAHILAIHYNFQGEINGIKVTDYPFGVVHENIITGCPYIYPPSGQTADQDNDGVVDCIDNCPAVPNPDQGPCWVDDDNDGVADNEDLDFIDTALKNQGFFCPF